MEPIWAHSFGAGRGCARREVSGRCWRQGRKMWRIPAPSHLQQCLMSLWGEMLGEKCHCALCHRVARPGTGPGSCSKDHCVLPGMFMGISSWCSNASDPVRRKWPAPGSHWICMCFMSLFPSLFSNGSSFWGRNGCSHLPLTPIKQPARHTGSKELAVLVQASHFPPREKVRF